MKKRTQGYFENSLAWLLALDGSPPFRWGAAAERPPSFAGPALAWLWNPSGKLLYESLDPARQKRMIERKFLVLALYDLVRISAGIHLREERAIAAALDPRNMLDRFSGRPYGWDAERGIAWSAGLDRRDDRGDPHADLALPVRTR
jgi:hypothetical protein